MSVRDLIKHSAVPAVIVNKFDLKILHFNEMAVVMTHWSGLELSGKFLSEILNPISGDPGDYDDVMLYGKGKRELIVHVNIQAVVRHNYLLVSFWETKREKSISLENEVNAWRKVFKEYGSPVTIHSPDYDLLDANQAACSLFGLKRDQMIGKKCYELFHGKEGPTINCPVEALIKSGHHVSRVVEIESIGKNALIDCSPVFDERGKLERIIHTAIDVGTITRMRSVLTKKKIVFDQEEQYRAITQSSSDAIITMDIEGKIVGWNLGARKIFGFSEDEILGKELNLILPKDFLKEHLNDFKNASHGAERSMIGEIFEVNGKRKDKTEFPAELSISEWEIGSGKYYTATIRDISARKLHEEALEEERNFSEAVLESLPGIFYLFTYPELRLKRWNKYHEELLGFTGKELRNRFVTEWFLPNIRQQVLDIMDEIIEAGYKRMDQYVVAKDGRLIPCILTGARIKIKDEQYIMGVGIDISLRKKAERELSKSEAQLRTLLNTIPNLVWLKDSNGVYLACNKSFERYINKTEEEIVGKTDFELIEPQQAKIFNEIDQEVIKTGKSVFSEEWTILDKSKGTKASIETVKTPVYDALDNLIGVLGIGHDITERKKAEAEIKNKNLELTKINAEKNKFFSVIAHDLLNPITSFLGLTQVMSENIQGLTKERIEEMTVSMKKSANSLFQLLENLLSWANMQQGIMQFKPETMDLAALTEEVLQQSIYGPAENKGIQINLDIPEEIKVFADRNMTQGVLRNLISNAIKFTYRSGKIFLSARNKDDDFVEIEIKDSGIGMKKEMLENLFVLNAKINRKGTEGEHSTGLGLMLCHEFVTKHGGKIWVESEEGKGSVFHFTLPKKELSKI